MSLIKAICPIALSALVSINLGVNAIAANFAQVKGTLSYPKLSPAPEATIYITLVNVSPRQDSSGDILARVAIANLKRSPIDFALQYNPARINPQHTYVVQARMTNRGEVIYTHTAPYPVITRGNPNTVDIVMTKK